LISTKTIIFIQYIFGIVDSIDEFIEKRYHEWKSSYRAYNRKRFARHTVWWFVSV